MPKSESKDRLKNCSRPRRDERKMTKKPEADSDLNSFARKGIVGNW